MMPNKTGATASIEHGKPLYGLAGVYHFAEDRSLPYFICTMGLNRFKDEIKIADEGDPSFTRRWNVEEIFQRELDLERVSEEIVNGYLRDPEQLVFFNAITVVLTPLTGDEDSPIGEAFGPLKGEQPPIPYDALVDGYDALWGQSVMKAQHVQGIQYVRGPPAYGNVARLRWDPECVFAVAVDGQHRLAALREWHTDMGSKTAFDDNRVPVIFILPDEEFGFKFPEEIPVRRISRSLFIDLNKTQERVDEIRELIMDDNDIVALCTSTLVTRDTHVVPEKSRTRLPLTCVLWKDNAINVDKNHYLNSLANLHTIVKDLFHTLPAPDSSDWKSVLDYFKELRRILRVDKIEVSFDNDDDGTTQKFTLEEYYLSKYCLPEGEEGGEKEYTVRRLFNRIPARYLKEAKEIFKLKHRELLVAILTEPTPYKKCLSYYKSKDLIDGDFGGFEVQTKATQKKLIGLKEVDEVNWYANAIEKPKKELIEQKSGKGGLLWNLVWQRAIIKVGRNLVMDHEQCTTDEYIAFIDQLCEDDLFTRGVAHNGMDSVATSVWDMIVINQGGGIRAGGRSQKTIGNIIEFWWYASNGNKELKEQGKKDMTGTAWYKEFDKAKADTKYPGMNAALTDVKGTYTWGRHCLRFGLDMDSTSGAEKDKAIASRYKKIISAGIVDLEEAYATHEKKKKAEEKAAKAKAAEAKGGD